MDVESITHKGLKRFFETGNPSRLVGDPARIRRMLVSFDDLRVPPNFGLHALGGDRDGTWAMTVTRNWRLTFSLNGDGQLIDLNLEDYHGA